MRQRILDLIKSTHLADRARQLARQHRTTVSVIDGVLSATQVQMRILMVGGGPDSAYFLHMAFGDDYSETSRDRVWNWKFQRFISRQKADLLVAVKPGGAIARYLHCRDVFEIPVWVRGEVDLESAGECQKTSRNVKTDLRRIRKNKLDYTVTTDPRLFDLFYHSMHVPHMKRVHKDGTFLLPYAEMKKKINQAELLLVTKDDNYLAGGIILYKSDGARAWTLGVKDGDAEFVKMGALSALHYYRFEYLRNKGFHRVNVGTSRGFLKDGALQYKKKWGMRLIGASRSKFIIEVLKPSKATRVFLVNNPFIQLRNTELSGVYFLDADKEYSEDSLREIFKSSYISGMRRLNLYHTSKNWQAVHIPDDMQDKIVVNTAGRKTGR